MKDPPPAGSPRGVAGRLRALLSPPKGSAAAADAPAAPTADESAPTTPDRRDRGARRQIAAASPSSASSCQSLEEEEAAAVAAAGMDASPLEGRHISLSEAAKRLSSPPRLNAERSMLRPGDQFWEQYQLTGKILGVGGFALVYEAVCLRDMTWEDGCRWTFRVSKGQRVAAKVMTTRRVDLGCIREEMDLMRQLQHPNVCSVVDPGLYCMQEPIGGGQRHNNGNSNGDSNGNGGWRPGDRYFPPPRPDWSPSKRESERALHRYREEVEQFPYIMILELCDEGSLYDYIMYGGSTPEVRPRSVAQAKRIFLDVLLGMHYLSSKLMVHQDIKIDNIYLTTIRESDDEPTYHEDGSISLVAKIGDLGLARLVGGRGSSALPPKAEAEAVGRFTCCHLSPDVRLGTLHPHASDDVYSLGLALFEFLTQERLNTTELGVSVRLTLRAYLRAKAASAASAFQDFLPLLHRLLHEHRLLRPRLDELIRDPVFRERRAWLATRLMVGHQQHKQPLASLPPPQEEEEEQQQQQQQPDHPHDHHHHHDHLHQSHRGALSLLLRQGRRDPLEDVGSRYKGRSLLLYQKVRPHDGGNTLRATFSFEDLRDDLQRAYHAKQLRAVGEAAGRPMLTLVVSASRNDWKTINNREASTCSAVLEMETRPLSPASPASPYAVTRRPFSSTSPAARSAAAHLRQQQKQQGQAGSSSSSFGRAGEDGAGGQWSAVVSFDQAFRPAPPPNSSRRRRRRGLGPGTGPLSSLSSLRSYSGGGYLGSQQQDTVLLELERVDGAPFHTVDRLFLGLFDRPRRLARMPFSIPRRFFSWRSIWSLYQSLRQAVHQLCPPDAAAPAVLILPLIGLVYRRETGPCVFVTDDSARKFVLQEIIGLVDYYATATTERQLQCVHVVSWNAATKAVITEDGLHSLDGDDPSGQPSPAALLEIVAEAVDAFAAATGPQLAEYQPDLVPALRAVLYESLFKTAGASSSNGKRHSSSGPLGLELPGLQGQQASSFVAPSLPDYNSSSTLTRTTSCGLPPSRPMVPAAEQDQQQLTPADVVERCFEAAIELSMALPAELPSPLVDLTLATGAASPSTPTSPSSYTTTGKGGSRGSSGGSGGGPTLREQCRLHVEVLKYNEMKRRFDREGLAAAPAQYILMTGPLEAARSAVALEATLRLLAANAEALSWGMLTPDFAALSPKARLQKRADQRMQRRLERALSNGEADGAGLGCWQGTCCAIS